MCSSCAWTPRSLRELVDAAANLKVIGVCSVGLNHVDMDACRQGRAGLQRSRPEHQRAVATPSPRC
ncbi:MAG: hypothetical protein ACLUJG_10800 [Lawsonibacter sp.]